MTTGAGFEPLGTSPAGIGEPIISAALVITGYQRSTLGTVSSVLINGLTKDYEYDSAGNEEGMGDTRQRVYMLMAEEFGSRQCSPKSGFSRPPTIGGNFRQDIETRARAALAPVLSDGSVRLDRVDTESAANSGLAYIVWTNLRTGVQDRVSAPLRQ